MLLGLTVAYDAVVVLVLVICESMSVSRPAPEDRGRRHATWHA